MGRVGVAGTRLRLWWVIGVLVVLCALPLTKGTMLVSAPYGDSHDGRNGSTWAAGAESLVADPVGSRLGAVRLDGTTYANHPPGILLVLGAARLVAGDEPGVARAPILIGLWVSIALAFVLVLAIELPTWAALVGAGAMAVSPMVRVYGTMVDTPMLAFPCAVASILVAVRLDRARPMRWWEMCTLAVGPLLSWQMLLLDGLIVLGLVADQSRRRHLPRVIRAVSIGATATALWLLWVHGSPGPIIDQLFVRSSVDGGFARGVAGAVGTQSFAFRTFYGPLLLVVPAGVALVMSAGRRRWASLLATMSVLLYCLLLSHGAANHDYWSYWSLLTVALGAAATVHGVHRLLSRSDFPVHVRTLVLVFLVGGLGGAMWGTTAVHEDVNVSSAEVAAVLADVRLPAPQRTLWALAEFRLGDQWMEDSGIEVRHLTEAGYRALLERGRDDDVVLASTSCVHPQLACDRLPGLAEDYRDRRFVLLRVNDLVRRHERQPT